MRGIFVGATLLLASVQLFGVTVDEIVKKANHAAYYQGQDGKAHIAMTIVDKQGRERQREFVMLRKDAEGKDDQDQFFYVYFKRPADVYKTSFLVWKHPKSEDDRWLYLPALDLVKRVAASDERTSFVGSHFYYEDVSGRSITEDVHKLVDESGDYYVVESTPKEPKTVEFKRYRNYIHKATFLPLKTEFIGQDDAVYRTYEATGVEVIEGYPTVVAAVMKDDRIGGYTTLTYTKVDYDIGLNESLFSERYLRRPPQRYLR